MLGRAAFGRPSDGWHKLQQQPGDRRFHPSRRCVQTSAKRLFVDKSPVILPGEDQDPLRWVREARDQEADVVLRTRPPKNRFARTRQDEQDSNGDTQSEGARAQPDRQGHNGAFAPPLPLPPMQPRGAPKWKHVKGIVKVRRCLQQQHGFGAVLDAVERNWPEWAANGCRLLDLKGDGQTAVPGPTPAEAAAALRVASEFALHSGSGGERLILARDRRITGLVEAVRVLPPRPPPGSDVSDDIAPLQHTAASITGSSDTPAAGAAADSPNAEAEKPVGVQKYFHPACLTDALWSLAVLGGPVMFEAEVDALLAAANVRDRNWQPRMVTDVLWALGLAHHWTDRLPELEKTLARLGGIAALTAREATSCLWTFATLNHAPTKLLAAVAEDKWQFANAYQPKNKPLPQRELSALSAKQLASIAWSLAAMDVLREKPFSDIWEEVGRRGLNGMGGLPTPLMQIHQVGMAVELEGNGEHPDNEGMEALLEAAAERWSTTIRPSHKRHESYHEAQIASTLVSLGLFHMKEDDSSGYSVDLSLPRDRIAIEADGPSHMARNQPPGRLLGHARMKHRHLSLMGWKVLSIPFHVWDELEGAEGKRRYLQDRISELKRSQSDSN